MLFRQIFGLALLSLLSVSMIIADWSISSELEQNPASLPQSMHVSGIVDATMNTSEDKLNGIRLIPRELFFKNPDKYRILNSLDGKWISYMAPYNGVLNVWVAPLSNLSATRVVTDDTFRGIQYYTWANTNRHILYVQDKDGDENWTIYSIDITTNQRRNLTPLEGVNARYKAPA